MVECSLQKSEDQSSDPTLHVNLNEYDCLCVIPACGKQNKPWSKKLLALENS